MTKDEMIDLMWAQQMGVAVLPACLGYTVKPPRSIHRQGLDRAYNPPPQTNRLAREVFFKPSKAPARARG